MNLSSLTVADFKRITRLLEQKETLVGKIAAIDAALAGYESNRKPTAKAVKTRKPGRTGKRGKLKEAILETLQKAGKGGITVKEIAAAVKRPPANIYTWFFNTGKKLKPIKKVGEAKYAWTAEG